MNPELGATHFTWRADVAAVVHKVLARFPAVTANTYIDHPWPGWDGQSVDFWGAGGRGDPLGFETAKTIRAFLFNLPGPPLIRHTILRHRLWTSFGGWSLWSSADHSGRLQHLHVTYW